jgi:ankyrin repeat protein
LLEEQSINNITTTNGVNALLIAASQGRVEMVKLLLEHNADAAYASALAKGLTALDAATRNEHTEVVDILQKHLAASK